MKPLVGTDVFPAAANSTYLDSASIALMNRDAAASAIDWQRRLAEEGTGSFNESDEENVFIKFHLEAARLFNGRPKDIAIGSSETILMSSLAWAIAPKKGAIIVATRICHPSTIYPWVRVAEHTGAKIRWVAAEDQYVHTDEILAAIQDDVAVVCLSHVEYGAGQRYDLERIAKATHERGALLIVDTTQSAGQVPIDVQAMGVDAATCSTYKWLCGPFGAAVMYVAPALQTLNPGIVGWRSHVDMFSFQADRLEYPPSASRFEFSTMSYGAAIAACKSLSYLLDVSIDRIAEHNQEIASIFRSGLLERNIQVLSPEEISERSAIVAARFEGDNTEIARRLKANNVLASLRNDFIRFSPHLFNGEEDIQRALTIIDQVAM